MICNKVLIWRNKAFLTLKYRKLCETKHHFPKNGFEYQILMDKG